MLNTSIYIFEEKDIIKLIKISFMKRRKILLADLQLENYKSSESNYKKLNKTLSQAINDSSTIKKKTCVRNYIKCRYQLSLLYEKVKEYHQQRISKCSNTIKRYQQHIDQNIEILNIKQQYENYFQQYKDQNSVAQSQFQYESQFLFQQIDELKKQQRDPILREYINFHESASKKRSVDSVKIKVTYNLMRVQLMQEILYCQPSFKGSNKLQLITQEFFKLIFSKQFQQQQYNIQSFEKSLPIDIRLQSIKHDQFRQSDQSYQRSLSREGLKSSDSNLGKMLGKNEICYQQNKQQITPSQIVQKVLVLFTQNQLNTLKKSTQQVYPRTTTLTMNENYVQKVRYNNNHSAHEEIKQNIENQYPSQRQSSSDIKMIIGKLLQTKGKQHEDVYETSQFSKFNRI